MAVVLLTGARGFVGRQIAKRLVALGMETHALSSTEADLSIPTHAWHRVDLMDTSATRALVDALRATHLVHAAWDTTHGAFWTSDANYAWVRATLALIEAFQAAGGRRLIVVGSCAEYDWRFGFCSEGTTPLNPALPYGVCKASLFHLSKAYAESHDISMAWARLFLLYGPHERPQRLVPSIANALLAGREAACTRGDQLRDLIHVEDAGRAIADLAVSGVSGAINIGSGNPIPLSSVGLEIGKQLGQPDLVQLGALPTRPDDPSVLIPDTRRLHEELGFKPRFDLSSGIADAIEFWRNQPANRTA